MNKLIPLIIDVISELVEAGAEKYLEEISVRSFESLLEIIQPVLEAQFGYFVPHATEAVQWIVPLVVIAALVITREVGRIVARRWSRASKGQ